MTSLTFSSTKVIDTKLDRFIFPFTKFLATESGI
jgi:hypothetical protein